MLRGCPCVLVWVGGRSDASLSLAAAAECPDQSPELQPWNPGHDQNNDVHIGQGRTLLLISSATVNSIHISDGGKPVSPPPLSLPLPRSPAASTGHRGSRWTEQRPPAAGSGQSICLAVVPPALGTWERRIRAPILAKGAL